MQELRTRQSSKHSTQTVRLSSVNRIFKYVDLHGRPQTTRFLVYGVVDVLMSQHRQGRLSRSVQREITALIMVYLALKRMGKDFISGYCQLVTGEKDPRNLRLAFSIERVMLVEFDINDNVEVRTLE